MTLHFRLHAKYSYRILGRSGNWLLLTRSRNEPEPILLTLPPLAP